MLELQSVNIRKLKRYKRSTDIARAFASVLNCVRKVVRFVVNAIDHNEEKVGEFARIPQRTPVSDQHFIRIKSLNEKIKRHYLARMRRLFRR